MRILRTHFFIPIIIISLIFAGCRKNLAPLQISYTPADGGFQFSACGEGLKTASLLYTATGGSFSKSGTGTVTIPQGGTALWLPDGEPKDANVQITVTAFDEQGRQLSVQTVSLNQTDSGVWTVAENELVTKAS